MFEFCGHDFEGAAVETHRRRRPAQQHDGAWARQLAQRRERAPALRQPGLVDRVEAAAQGDDVGAGAAVVFGSDHQVPVRGRQPGMQDLHDARTAFAQQPGGQRRAPAGADGQRGRCLQAGKEAGAERLLRPGQSPGRQPAPGHGGVQFELAHLRRQRLRQRKRLPAVTGGTVVQDPAGKGRRGHRPSLAGTVAAPRGRGAAG